MTRFFQGLVQGFGFGSIYALIAVGFVIIYKSTRIISFTQPALMLAGGVMVHYLVVAYDLPFFVGVPIAMLLTAGVGLLLERSALRPMVGEPVFVVAIITLGLDVVVRTITNRFIGRNIRPVGDPWGLSTWNVGGVVIQQRFVWMTVITALVVVALLAFFKYSRVGLAMRAASFDQETSLAQGIPVGLVFALSWAIAGALAALAGSFVGTGAGLDQQSFTIAFKALPAIILGGLDSLTGAIIGGVAIGIVEALVATYQGTYAPWLGNDFANVSPYLLMLIVLLMRPYGLFGTPEIERV